MIYLWILFGIPWFFLGWKGGQRMKKYFLQDSLGWDDSSEWTARILVLTGVIFFLIALVMCPFSSKKSFRSWF